MNVGIIQIKLHQSKVEGYLTVETERQADMAQSTRLEYFVGSASPPYACYTFCTPYI